MAVTNVRGRQIYDGTVQYVDIQNVTANTILGNNTAGATTIQEIALATNNLLGRGSSNIVALSLGTGLTISGSQLQVNTNLTSLAGLSYSSASFVKMTASGTFSLDTNVYVSSTGSASYVAKFTSSSAVQNSLIYDNGTSIGIGTTAPSSSYILDIRTPAANTGVIFRSLNSSTTGSNPMTITSDDTWQTVFKVGNTTTREYHLGVSGSSNTGIGSGSFGIYDGFATTYRLLIANDGRILMGTTTFSGTYLLQVNGTIYASGDVIAYSDASVKTNIRSIENPLKRLLKTRGVVYDRTDNDDKDNIGFIAQELEEQFPELVSKNSDGTKGVKYQNTVAVLIEAMKEQQLQIENLKSQINYIVENR